MPDWRAHQGREQFRRTLGIDRARQLASEASPDSDGSYNAFTPLGDYLAMTRWAHVPTIDRVMGLASFAFLLPIVGPIMIGTQLLATVGIRVNEYRHPFVSAFVHGCILAAIVLVIGLLADVPGLVEVAPGLPFVVTLVVGTMVWLDTRGYMPPPGSMPDSYWQILLAALVTRASRD